MEEFKGLSCFTYYFQNCLLTKICFMKYDKIKRMGELIHTTVHTIIKSPCVGVQVTVNQLVKTFWLSSYSKKPTNAATS